ncbi:hypothetical protein C8F04DRAFT_994076 [Mycena alexandri]|uniref:G-protein coupled receptors family 2 profile 2 domain-containing protein n=1 Tax=Mycena alexandri TaxID=1745969 RepID=A0AAD6XEH5_9AGAR|nr:hypothetical protein C8F04DRAFT_994076 [Mycena alexandri]
MASNDGFVFTDELVQISNQLWAVTAMIGAAFCGAVLIVIGIVAMSPVSRQHLDRVSFRILVWALAANTIFGVANAIGGKFTGPTWACGFTIFLLQFTLELSSFLLFSIALNLQLVVVHQVNGQKMERYYVLGSWLISLGLTVPAYASRQYGWDPLVEDCWYSNPDTKARLAWQIGTQLFWTLLTVAGEVVTASTVVIFMVQHQLRKARTLSAAVIESRTRSRSGSVVAVNDRVAHANVYRGIILRIVLYPVASALINLTSVACVMHATQKDGVHDWTGYRVLLLSDFVYGGRAVLYALLAATDPALVRAVRAFIQHSRGISPNATFASGGRSTTEHGPTDSKNHPLSVHIELATIYQNDDGAVVTKSPTSPSGYSEETLKPARDIEAAPRQNSLGTQIPAGSERNPRLQEHVIRRRAEMLARDRDRDEFQKQI